MSAILFLLMFTVVLAAAIYSRLPLTIVCMTSAVAFMSSMQAHAEPLNTVLRFLSIPMVFFTNLGRESLGLGAPWSAGIVLILTLGLDMALTNKFGPRR
jgi:hypothetical protein